MKYLSTAVDFIDIPGEVCLAFNLTHCSNSCVNCHFPEMRKDIGIEVTAVEIRRLIGLFPKCTCILFLGGDRNHGEILSFCEVIRKEFPSLKLAVFSRLREIDISLLPFLNYYKIGYCENELGPTKKDERNQRLFKIENGWLFDITPSL